MSIEGYFQDFSLGSINASGNSEAGGDPLDGYEDGYKAGWDDASKAHQDTNTHLTSVLQRNLEQIDFTVTEAQGQLLASLRPTITEITATLLPGLASQSLRALIEDELVKLMRNALPDEITIQVSPADKDAVAAILATKPELSKVGLEARDTFAEGQAYITCVGQQRKIDVAQAMADIQTTLTDFVNQPLLEQAHAG